MEQNPLLTVLEEVLHLHQLDSLHLHLTQLHELLKTSEAPDTSQLTAVAIYPPLQKILLSFTPEQLEAKHINPLLHELRSAAEKRKVVKMTVACEFETADLKEMITELSARVGYPVVLKLTIDPKLIGGAIIEYGNFASDYTIKTRMEHLKKTWNKAVTHENA